MFKKSFVAMVEHARGKQFAHVYAIDTADATRRLADMGYAVLTTPTIDEEASRWPWIEYNRGRAAYLRERHAGGMPGKLTGPRGKFRSGERIVRSQFQRFERNGRTGWQWVAFGEKSVHSVLHVIEIPDMLADVCDSPNGALWALRECVAWHLHEVRSHRGH